MQEIGRTRYLILGLLAEGPCSGYDIRRVTAARFRFFWSESFGQIYPCLKQLERDGLIERSGRAGRGKVLWAIADPGRSVLENWLQEDSQPETARIESVLKYYFSWAMPAEGRQRLLATFIDRQEKNLAELESFRRELLAIPDPHGNHDLALDTIGLGIATYSAWRDWAAGLQGSKR
jgi:PadR family transcriptional regulator, regulatory protein AphA